MSDALASSTDENSALFQPFKRHLFALCGGELPLRIGIALSGGSDSLALTLLANELLQNENCQIFTFTVDHQLRPESKQEAKEMASLMQHKGIKHEVLNWNHQAPLEGNLQANARQARYQLLEQACRQHHIPCLLTGHTQDDQAETIAMRKERGAETIGLAGMSAKRSLSEHVTLLRPLLFAQRATLQSHLNQQNQTWISDPSNQNEDFTRIKIRNYFAQNPEEKAETLQLGKESAAKRMIWEAEANSWLKQYANTKTADRVEFSTFDFAKFQTLTSVPYLILRQIILHIGRKEHPPRFAKMETLFAQIKQLRGSATLGHCQIRWDDQTVIFTLEAAHKPQREKLPAKPLVIVPFYPIY